LNGTASYVSAIRAAIGGKGSGCTEQETADQSANGLVALTSGNVIRRLMADLVGNHHRYLFLVVRVLGDTAIYEDHALRPRTSIQ
jgi:hypothetical protein